MLGDERPPQGVGFHSKGIWDGCMSGELNVGKVRDCDCSSPYWRRLRLLACVWTGSFGYESWICYVAAFSSKMPALQSNHNWRCAHPTVLLMTEEALTAINRYIIFPTLVRRRMTDPPVSSSESDLCLAAYSLGFL